ncbi:MAG TPA: gliding motility protein GldL [Prolixibacteraceae bacterium]|nr:gliding motility protein GldL [Prolixibacteraceae bacterium]
MNIGEILKTKRWKVLMGYVYGWGASLVLIGALFKLQHWNHSGIMLTIGLMTEAFIFFLSAFEPPLEIPDWTRVYPELQEDYQLVESVDETKGPIKGLDSILDSTNITPELLTKVSKSLIDLSNTASGISDISTATLATDVYVKNLNSASESVSAFSEMNTKANNMLNNSLSELVNSYSNTATKISETGDSMLTKLNESSTKFVRQIDESGNKLNESYSRFSGAMEKGIKELEGNSVNYSDNLNKLNRNIELLNQNYEKQLKGTSEQFHASAKFFEELNQMNQIIATSAQEMKKYKENAEKLNAHLDALNSVYGNMLGAMNYKKK